MLIGGLRTNCLGSAQSCTYDGSLLRPACLTCAAFFLASSPSFDFFGLLHPFLELTTALYTAFAPRLWYSSIHTHSSIGFPLF